MTDWISFNKPLKCVFEDGYGHLRRQIWACHAQLLHEAAETGLHRADYDTTEMESERDGDGGRRTRNSEITNKNRFRCANFVF